MRKKTSFCLQFPDSACHLIHSRKLIPQTHLWWTKPKAPCKIQCRNTYLLRALLMNLYGSHCVTANIEIELENALFVKLKDALNFCVKKYKIDCFQQIVTINWFTLTNAECKYKLWGLIRDPTIATACKNWSFPQSLHHGVNIPSKISTWFGSDLMYCKEIFNWAKCLNDIKSLKSCRTKKIVSDKNLNNKVSVLWN